MTDSFTSSPCAELLIIMPFAGAVARLLQLEPDAHLQPPSRRRAPGVTNNKPVEQNLGAVALVSHIVSVERNCVMIRRIDPLRTQAEHRIAVLDELLRRIEIEFRRV